MVQEDMICPFCGSYSVHKNKCKNCGKDIREQKYSQIIRSESIQEEIQPTTESTQTGSSWYELKNNSVYDANGNKICSKKLNLSMVTSGNFTFKTSSGSLKINKNQPDKISILDVNNLELGRLNLIEKDSYVLEILNETYSLDNIEAMPFNVRDEDNESTLTIEDNPEGYTTNRLGIPRPSFKFSTNGKLKLEVAILVAMFVVNYYQFFYFVKPSVNYSFLAKKRLGLKFYDSQRHLYAKVNRINKKWLILGALTFFFVIGMFIIFYKGIKERNSRDIVLQQTGEKIASFKGDFNFSKVEFNIPAKNWSGSINFHRIFLTGKKMPPDIIKTSDGDYTLKLLSIVEDKNNEKMLTVYGISNNLVVVKNDKFDDYKSLLLATIIINRFLSPQKSELG